MNSNSATEFYQGYAQKKVFNEEKDIKEYIKLSSENALKFHFNNQTNWGKVVVDFGGRIGEKTQKIENVTVVEIDASARKWMNEKGVKCSDSIENFTDGSIDTIYCSHVLEHLENPMDYLRIFYRKLRVGGKLILVLPADEQTFDFRQKIVEDNGHLQTWTIPQINLTLSRVGFCLRYNKLNEIVGFPVISRYLNKNRNYFNLMHKCNDFRSIRALLYFYNRIYDLLKEIMRVFTSLVFSKNIYYISTIGEMIIQAEKEQ